MSTQETYVIVPVKVQIVDGVVSHIEAPSFDDAQASLKGVGPIASKDKLFKLLASYGGMLKGFLK